MNRSALTALVFALATAPVLAQQGPPSGTSDGPQADVMQHMAQLRDGARTQAMTALSADHQAKVNAILARIKAGQLSDAHDDAQQIDAILNAKEAKAVLAARDKMMADMRASAQGPGGAEAGDAPPGAQGGPDGPGGPGGPGGGPGGPGGGFGGPGGPPGGGLGGGPGGTRGGFGGPPDGGRHGMHAMRDDAGFALLTLNLDRDQLRALFENGRPAQ